MVKPELGSVVVLRRHKIRVYEHQIVPIFVPTLFQNGRTVRSNPAQLISSSAHRIDCLPLIG
jgi:hypothetical protein